MFHPDTQFLIDHWTALAAAPDARGGVPDRARLDPAALGPRVSRTFILDTTRPDRASIRLAGDWIEALHDKPLTGSSWASLWTPASRAVAEDAVRQALQDLRPVLVPARIGRADAEVEVVLAPMRGPEGTVSRMAGLYVPLATLALGPRDIRRLTARRAASIPGGRRELSLAAVDGRRVARA